ncbi:MAG: PAS domain S-box protein [Acidobacteria bacterium]|nr:PAS domain S-box protein [Acidobacteriota bacterium]
MSLSNLVNRIGPGGWIAAGAGILVLWTGVSMMRLLIEPIQDGRAPLLVERLESLAFYLMEDLEDQGARPDRKFDGNSARARVDRFYEIYQRQIVSVNAAAAGLGETEESLVRAHEWMARVARARETIRPDTAEPATRAAEADWRANGAQAVVELRTAVLNLRSVPVQALKKERASRMANLFTLLGLSIGLLLGAIFVAVRSGKARASEQRQSAAKPAVNPAMPSMIENAAGVALQFTREAVVTLDPTLRVLAMNPAAEHLFGYRSAQAMGVYLQSLVPSLNLKGEIPDNATVEPSFETALRGSGKQVPIELSLHLSNRQGRRVVIALAREAVSAAAAMDNTTDTSASVVADMAEHCPAPLVIFDTEAVVVHVNQAFADVMRAGFDEIQSRPYWKLFMEGEQAERARREWLLLASMKLPDSVQQTWRAGDGRSVPMTWARSAMRDEQGRVRFVVCIGLETQKVTVGVSQRRAA